MKSVLISIQPKWCELIANGKKTIEVRKTRPKNETPFKCYIYESRNGGHRCKHCKEKDDCYYYAPKNIGCYNGRGRIIGEFVCDNVEKFSVGSLRCDDIEKFACLSYKEMIDYFYKPEELDGNTAKMGYAWHISDLKIYDNPKELSEFEKYYECGNNSCGNCNKCDKDYHLTRPPQSWSYVEELEEEK